MAGPDLMHFGPGPSKRPQTGIRAREYRGLAKFCLNLYSKRMEDREKLELLGMALSDIMTAKNLEHGEIAWKNLSAEEQDCVVMVFDEVDIDQVRFTALGYSENRIIHAAFVDVDEDFTLVALINGEDVLWVWGE